MKLDEETSPERSGPHEKTPGCEPPAYDYTEQVGHLLRRAYQRHLAIFQARSANSQLTSVQFSVLCALNTYGPSSQVDLVRTSAIDQATIRGILERLKRRNLIKTASDENDQRKVIYALTDEGRQITFEMIPIGLQISEQTVQDLNPAERLAFSYLLNKLINGKTHER